MSLRKKLIVGNWKMNGLMADVAERFAHFANFHSEKADMVICPAFVHIAKAMEMLRGGAVQYGAQDCHAESSGAFTGNISAEMLKDMGCTYVILGHSERRQYHAETDAQIAQKMKGASRAGLKIILCVGETADERAGGAHHARVKAQLENSITENIDPSALVIAYEPIWAIGTGKVATLADIEDMHRFINGLYPKHSVLYGGSVTAESAKAILAVPYVDGILVGGASLKVEAFLTIAKSA